MTVPRLVAFVALSAAALAITGWAWTGYGAVGVALWLSGLPLC